MESPLHIKAPSLKHTHTPAIQIEDLKYVYNNAIKKTSNEAVLLKDQRSNGSIHNNAWYRLVIVVVIVVVFANIKLKLKWHYSHLHWYW